MKLVAAVCLLATSFGEGAVAATGWKAGVASLPIAPDYSLWMAGYAARTKPSEGTAQPLHVKVLALEDSSKQRSLLVTADILGFPQGLSRRIVTRIEKAHGIPRERLLLNASHTHSGPVIERNLSVAYEMTDAQWAAVERYTKELEEKVVDAAARALKKLEPVTLRFGQDHTGFATNRRLRIYPNGPVDQDVPVLRVDRRNGQPLALIFGYACHNTTLGGDFVKFHGDYAGVAQELVEKANPGAVALYVTGCGADANPSPRGTLALAEAHGGSLAYAVDRASKGALRPVGGPLRAAYREVALPFAGPPVRADYERILASGNKYEKKHAQAMTALIDKEGKVPATYDFPAQVWQFGTDLTLVALAGEVVADYSLNIKKELGGATWVAGYSNDVFAYIPSVRVLKEGGYEGGGAMIYYGQPGPFAPPVEERILETVRDLVKQTRASK